MSDNRRIFTTSLYRIWVENGEVKKLKYDSSCVVELTAGNVIRMTGCDIGDHSISLSPPTARELADYLIALADKLEGKAE